MPQLSFDMPEEVFVPHGEKSVREIGYDDCVALIMNIHYAGRMPSVSYAFGLFYGNYLEGVITFGSPASPHLHSGVLGEKNKSSVLELNRLVLRNNNRNDASYFIGRAIKLLPKPLAIVSYADTAQGHTGAIYRATNFLFTGTTKERTDIAAKDGAHSRHHLGDRSVRVGRSAKHRYIYLHGNRKQKKEMMGLLRYPPQQYKEDE